MSEAEELRDLIARLVEELSRRRGELLQKNYAIILEPRIEDLKVEYLPDDAPGIYIYHRPGRVLLRRRRVYYHIDEDKLKSTSPMNEYHGRIVDIISRRYADLKGLRYEHSREITSKELTMILSRAIKEGSLKSLPDRLARWYEESGNPRVVRYYLSGLRLNAGRIDLGDGAVLRRPTSADVEDVLSADLWEIAEGSPSYLMGVFSTLLESIPRPSEEGVKISFGVPATPSAVLEWEETGGNDWRQRRADANSYAARLITALVLLGKCYPTPEDPLKQPPLSFHGALSQDPSALSSILGDGKYWLVEPHGLLFSKDPYSFLPSPSVPWLTNRQCRVAEEDAGRLRELWGYLKSSRISFNEDGTAKERGPLGTALNRYLRSLSVADAPEESVAYAVMAIEAILKEGEERGKLKKIFKERATNFLELFGRNIGCLHQMSKEKMWDYFEKAYSIRSAFVHGDDIEDIEDKYEDLPELVGGCARLSILALLLLGVDNGGYFNEVKEKLINLIKESPPIPKKLNEYLSERFIQGIRRLACAGDGPSSMSRHHRFKFNTALSRGARVIAAVAVLEAELEEVGA